MKILFLTRRFYPHVGGVEKHIWKVSEWLITEGHDVSIIAENHSPSVLPVGWTTQKNLPVLFVNFGKESTWKKFHIWRWMIAHMRLFLQADVIHAHDVMFWYFPLRFLLFWKPVYTTFHGDEKRFPPTKKAISTRKLSAFLAKGSINVGSYLEKWYGVNADVTIWGAVEKTAVLAKIMPDSPLHILLLGRLEKDISIQKYVELLKKLKDEKFRFELDVCGDGTASMQLKKYGKMHGFVDDVNPYISESHVVFCSSYLAILEALSQGRRIIAFYENPMKKDYLSLSPFAKWICITDSVEEAAAYCVELGAKPYSQSQKSEIDSYIKSISWDAIAHQYIHLWSK
ncbi:glycosyltransferase family 4 protein [Candidatus Woesebacteria bacterium]|nr:glycosyltransferase family 4 protein [Candidatus Woesebacteria bacterium]